jgi:hypothetical protein
MAAVWQSAFNQHAISMQSACNQHAISMQSEVTRVPAAAPQRAMPKSGLIWLIREAAPVVEQRIDLGHDHKASGTFG